MKKILKFIGGIVVIAVVLIVGIVMGMEHNKSSASDTQKTEQVAKPKKKKAPVATKTATKTTSTANKSDDNSDNEQAATQQNATQDTTSTDSKNSTDYSDKKFADVPYTCTWKGDTYTLLLKGNGEYIYNYKVANIDTNNPGIIYTKGTYEINSAGVIRYKTVATSLDARWPTADDILSTTPTDVSFLGKGSRYGNSGNPDGNFNYFTVINDGDEIQGSVDGVDLKPQPGLEVTDPEAIGPKLHQEYIDSQNH